MAGEKLFFEQIRSSGCLSYVLGCADEKKCVVIDPELDKAEEYVELAKFFSCQLVYAIDTHTHADHNSACKILREKYGANVVMHQSTDAPYVDIRVADGDTIAVGAQSLQVIHTPGHTADAMCLLFRDRLFTGDTLLIGGCGRTDLPGGDAAALYASLRKVEALGDEIRVYPGHDYREAVSTLGEEKKSNARIQIANQEEFVRFMTSRKPPFPRKIDEALEWNRTPIQGTQRGMGEGI